MSFFFYKIGWGWHWCCGKREQVGKGGRRVNMVEYYVLVYENGKMRPVGTVPGFGEGEI
jgi:hypothetical protein